MHARATKRKPSFSKRLGRALLCGALLTALGCGAAPAEAATKSSHTTGKQSKKKAHKPSKAHLKIKSDLAKAKSEETLGDSELGAASFYGSGFQGRRVATGERFNLKALTAASNRYPLGSWVAVRRLDSDRCVVVRINDRMHTRHQTRIIDLSRSAAEQLRMIAAGVVLVRVARVPGMPESDSEAACLAAFAGELPMEGMCDGCADAPAIESSPLEIKLPSADQ